MLKRADLPTINAKNMQVKATKSTFLALIKALNEADQYGRRHDYVFRHTKGRTESTKEVTELEAKAIITELNSAAKPDKADRMRKKIISMAYQMGWTLPKTGKADMKRIDEWCRSEKGPYHKALNSHDIKELGILTGVFEKVYKQYMNKL
jgi:hypothetical protein